MQPEQVRTLAIDAVQPHPDNPRRGNTEAIAKSIEALGQYKPIVVQASTGYIIAGNHTWKAMKQLGRAEVSAVVLDVDDTTAKSIMVADNRTSDLGDYDDEQLNELLAGLLDEGVDPDLLGYDIQTTLEALEQADQELATEQPPVAAGSLSERFLAPPFSVIDARTGWWLGRKRQWLDRGVGGLEARDEAREGATSYKIPVKAADYLVKKGFTTGTSVFDPVLAELCYIWFCPKGGHVFDPFAGGPPRGLVATQLGLKYSGVDLSQEQVDLNFDTAWAYRKRWGTQVPVWMQGDSRYEASILRDEQFDMVFTCPPYYDLEKYSDNDKDLSNMDTDAFDEAYMHILRESFRTLKNDRFAVIVVGSVRDKRGGLRDLRAVTCKAAADAGLRTHSEAVLINSIGTAAIRAGYTFPRTRLLIRNHQEVLVFIKGSPNAAAKLCGEVDVDSALNTLEGQDDV
jgi:ParB-like chromosome segregation protein Spo0J